MHRDLMIKAAAVAALSTVVLASTAVAQDPQLTPPPRQEQGTQTEVIFNSTAAPTLNSRIDIAARAGHESIGGKYNETKPKKNAYFRATGSTTNEVILAAIENAESRTLVIITGGNGQQSVGGSRIAPETVFVDIGQPLPCVTADGIPDPSGTCGGGADAVPFNYTAVNFQVEDAAYLAGVIAASAASTRSDRLGIISGLRECEECNRYIQGFLQGAMSVDPDIEVELAFLSDGDENAAFGDAASAKSFAAAFIDVHQPDVLLSVTRGAMLGVIEAACDAGILAVGTDIDVRAHRSDLGCVLTSITKDVDTAVSESFARYVERGFEPLPPVWNQTLADGGVDITDDWTTLPTLPVAAADRYNDARTAILTSQIVTCPTDCGQPFGPGVDQAPSGDDAAVTESETDG